MFFSQRYLKPLSELKGVFAAKIKGGTTLRRKLKGVQLYGEKLALLSLLIFFLSVVNIFKNDFLNFI